MTTYTTLQKYPSLHHSISLLLQKNFTPFSGLSTHILSDVEIINFSVEDFIVSLDFKYEKNDMSKLSYIKEYINCNKCILLIEKSDNVYSIDVIHNVSPSLHLSPLKDSVKNEEYFLEIETYMQDLVLKEYTQEEKNMAEKKNFERLISWAKEMKIPSNIFPRNKEELQLVEKLDLSKCNLEFIPGAIKVLTALKEINLSFNKLTSLPRELCFLKNLEKLWIPYNYIREIPNEIVMLKNLKEFVAISNYLTKLPDMYPMKQLTYIAMSGNQLSEEVIANYLNKFTHQIQSVFQYQEIALSFNVEPLSKCTLKSATALQCSVFKDLNSDEKQSLAASLDKEQYESVYKNLYIKDMQYWVAKDIASGKVIGLTGLYTEPEEDENICWIGWFCVDDSYRGKGYGNDLLSFTKQMTKTFGFDDRLEGYDQLHLYAYDSKEFKVAINLYMKSGFEEYSPKFKIQKKNKYLKCSLI